MYFLFFKVNEMINDDKKSPKEKEIINKDRCCYSTKWNNNKSDNDNGKKIFDPYDDNDDCYGDIVII